jgi:choline-sulfatase
VPLFVHGAGLAPGVVEHPTSSVDLAPTLAELAGLPSASPWLGQSLLSLDRSRPVYLFQCQGGPRSTLGVVDAQRKLIGYEVVQKVRDAELFAAFDLAADPNEQHDLLESGESWPEQLYRRHEQVILQLLERRVNVRESQLSADELDELRAMGYGGD